MKRIVDKLPDVKKYKVGDRVKYGHHIYEKKLSGRWSTVITKYVVKEVYDAYCVKGMNFRECKAYLNKPGLPTIPVQTVLSKKKWFRSHYERGARYRQYLQDNKERIEKAICKYNIPKAVVWSYIGLPKQFDALGIIKNLRTADSRVYSCIDTLDVNTDVNLLSYKEYKGLIYAISKTMVKRFGKSFGIKKFAKDCHLDHKFSIFSGYYVKGSTVRSKIKRSKVVPIKYMAHPYNLQYLSPHKNSVKGVNNTISGKELKLLVDSCNIQVSSPQDYYKYVFNLLRIEKNGANKVR